MAIKGLNSLVYVPLVKDDLTGVEYGTEVKDFPAGQNLTITPNVIGAKLHGNDILLEEESAIESITVSVTLADLPLNIRAELLGHNYENGVLKNGSEDVASEIAFGFKAPKSKYGGGGERRMWLLKGKGKPVSDDYESKGENIVYKPSAIEFTFMSRVADGELMFMSDSKDEGAPPNDKFFTVAFLKDGKVTA